ncbi:MAG: hypothetical protein DI535_03385 [Citrobacter freundii]|nr:MAG: hypothetical protein DI535_03385 [Citrobacter freundii]
MMIRRTCRLFFGLIIPSALLISCSSTKALRSADKDLFAEKVLQTAHTGIAVYDVAAGRFVYDHQGDKYFVPASNTKIPTCYAAMKYLGDSITAFKYNIRGKDTIVISGTGAPDLLHPDFAQQDAFTFLKRFPNVYLSTQLYDEPLGSGWAWSDYKEYYMARRSELPLYGNIVKFKWVNASSVTAEPSFFSRETVIQASSLKNGFELNKPFDQNTFLFIDGTNKSAEVPFNPDINTITDLLKDTLKANVILGVLQGGSSRFKSRPLDDVLKPMMHRSDNFFAEQMLLMVSQEKLGVMNDGKIIDTLLKTDFASLPQKPRWADGSGLSRYNLFSPKDFVFILDKMQKEFGMDRIKKIFPTGGKGTLNNYYLEESGQLFAKTGTLSGVVAISGFVYSKKGKLLIFSALVNNHNGAAADVRHAVERFIRKVREQQ